MFVQHNAVEAGRVVGPCRDRVRYDVIDLIAHQKKMLLLTLFSPTRFVMILLCFATYVIIEAERVRTLETSICQEKKGTQDRSCVVTVSGKQLCGEDIRKLCGQLTFGYFFALMGLQMLIFTQFVQLVSGCARYDSLHGKPAPVRRPGEYCWGPLPNATMCKDTTGDDQAIELLDAPSSSDDDYVDYDDPRFEVHTPSSERDDL
jgi:hypothetical protein